MKSIFTLGIILLFSSSCRRAIDVSITGDAYDMENTKVILKSRYFDKSYDSTIVRNKRFILHTSVPDNDFYQLNFVSAHPYKGTNWMHSCLLYLEKGAAYSIKLSSPDELLYEHYSVTSTSNNQNKLNEFKLLYRSKKDSLLRIKSHYKALANNFLSGNNDAKYRMYCDSIDFIDSKIKDSYLMTVRNFVNQNNNTVITPYLITNATNLFNNYLTYENALRQTTPAVKDSKFYQQANELLQSAKRIYKGADVPPIHGKSLRGGNANINFGRSKITLIDFWASYCMPCRNQTIELKELYSKYKSKGFNIISISIDENDKFWKVASQQDEIPWTNICESVNQDKSENIKNFVVKSIPANYLIDNKGKIVSKDIELEDLKIILKALDGKATSMLNQ